MSPSSLPVRIPPPEPSSLRAKAIPRSLIRSPRRQEARRLAAEALDRACVKHGVGNRPLSSALGLVSDREAAEARSGALGLGAGDAAILLPLPVAVDVDMDLLEERIQRERVANGDSTELRLALVHIAAIRTLLSR